MGVSRKPFVILMGLRGSGKSTVGRFVADRLGLPFVDLDDLTPKKLGAADAAGAISAHGFDAFRRAEAGALRDVLDGSPAVLALGGGTPTAVGVAEMLGEQTGGGAALVYLHAPPAVLRERLASTDTRTRPSLTGMGMLDEIGRVYLDRDGLYRTLCTRLIETEGRSAEDIAAMIAGVA